MGHSGSAESHPGPGQQSPPWGTMLGRLESQDEKSLKTINNRSRNASPGGADTETGGQRAIFTRLMGCGSCIPKE